MARVSLIDGSCSILIVTSSSVHNLDILRISLHSTLRCTYFDFDVELDIVCRMEVGFVKSCDIHSTMSGRATRSQYMTRKSLPKVSLYRNLNREEG
jgi:hypothetical protein